MFKPNKLITRLFTLLISGILCASIHAEEEAPKEDAKKDLPPLMYFQISPEIQTFYQSDEKKYGYVVVQIQMTLRGQDNFDLVETHMPLIQDALTDFFNRQTKDDIRDLQKRETLRVQATERVIAVLTEEVGKPVIEQVLFTQYIYQ